MISKQEKGRCGEQLALEAYEKLGYALVGQNYRCRWGEIDLIVKNDVFFVFCEVKLRNGTRFGSGLDAVTPAKREKIIKSAQQFLCDYPVSSNLQLRFDVFAIQIEEKHDKILVQSTELIENAFEVVDRGYDSIF